MKILFSLMCVALAFSVDCASKREVVHKDKQFGFCVITEPGVDVFFLRPGDRMIINSDDLAYSLEGNDILQHHAEDIKNGTDHVDPHSKRIVIKHWVGTAVVIRTISDPQCQQ